MQDFDNYRRAVGWKSDSAFRRSPPNGDIEQLEKAFSRLAEGLTYIHCAQGHGRTGLFAAQLLARQG